MNRSITATFLWVSVLCAMGAALFLVKHVVKDLEARLAAVNRGIVSSQDNIHVLNAEWSYLNNPARLRQLAERHLGMHPMGPSQLVTLNTLNEHPSALALNSPAGRRTASSAATTAVITARAADPPPPRRNAAPSGLAMVSSGEAR